MTSNVPHDSRTEFDEFARRAHTASLDHLSPRVRAQLAQRRHAALVDNARPPIARRWPVLALGSAAALTLAIGLFALRGHNGIDTPPQAQVAVTPTQTASQQMPAAPATAAAPPITATASAPVPAAASTETPEPLVESIRIDDALQAELLAAELSDAEDAMGFDSLEESPDFYLWLGSDNAQADTSEFL